MKILTTIHLLILLFSFASCDRNGNYQYWIDNKSDSALYLSYKLKYDVALTKISILPNRSQLIEDFGSTNGLYDYGDDFLETYFGTFVLNIDTVNNVSVKKAYLTRDNWDYRQENATGLFKKSGDNIYTLVINDVDL